MEARMAGSALTVDTVPLSIRLYCNREDFAVDGKVSDLPGFAVHDTLHVDRALDRQIFLRAGQTEHVWDDILVR